MASREEEQEITQHYKDEETMEREKMKEINEEGTKIKAEIKSVFDEQGIYKHGELTVQKVLKTKSAITILLPYPKNSNEYVNALHFLDGWRAENHNEIGIHECLECEDCGRISDLVRTCKNVSLLGHMDEVLYEYDSIDLCYPCAHNPKKYELNKTKRG